jgi:hypothetical protein
VVALRKIIEEEKGEEKQQRLHANHVQLKTSHAITILTDDTKDMP